MGGIRLEQLAASLRAATIFSSGRRSRRCSNRAACRRRECRSRPMRSAPQVAAWIRGELNAYVKQHDGEPGRVTVRRLTSGEYGIRGPRSHGARPGYRNRRGDAIRWAARASRISATFSSCRTPTWSTTWRRQRRSPTHAVIGSGPIEFFADPGKTGFELSAITRIKEIYDGAAASARFPAKAASPTDWKSTTRSSMSTWLYQHRAALGRANATLEADRGARGSERAFRAACLDRDAHADAGLSVVRDGGALAQAARARRGRQGEHGGREGGLRRSCRSSSRRGRSGCSRAAMRRSAARATRAR